MPHLLDLLDGEQVLMHPIMVGELACGNLRDRGPVLEFLSDLPEVTIAFAEELLVFIKQHQLMGRGSDTWTLICWHQPPSTSRRVCGRLTVGCATLRLSWGSPTRLLNEDTGMTDSTNVFTGCRPAALLARSNGRRSTGCRPWRRC